MDFIAKFSVELERSCKENMDENLSAVQAFIQQLCDQLEGYISAGDLESQEELLRAIDAGFSTENADILQLLDAILYDVFQPITSCASSSPECERLCEKFVSTVAHGCAAREVLPLFNATLDRYAG